MANMTPHFRSYACKCMSEREKWVRRGSKGYENMTIYTCDTTAWCQTILTFCRGTKNTTSICPSFLHRGHDETLHQCARRPSCLHNPQRPPTKFSAFLSWTVRIIHALSLAAHHSFARRVSAEEGRWSSFKYPWQVNEWHGIGSQLGQLCSPCVCCDNAPFEIIQHGQQFVSKHISWVHGANEQWNYNKKGGGMGEQSI